MEKEAGTERMYFQEGQRRSLTSSQQSFKIKKCENFYKSDGIFFLCCVRNDERKSAARNDLKVAPEWK